jgi:hypothetical protein
VCANRLINVAGVSTNGTGTRMAPYVWWSRTKTAMARPIEWCITRPQVASQKCGKTSTQRGSRAHA